MADDSVEDMPLSINDNASGSKGKEAELDRSQAVVEGNIAPQSVEGGLGKDWAVNARKESITNNDDNHQDEQMGKGKVDRIVGGDDRTPRVGMVFTSYDEVCSFYKRYALHVGFGVAVRKSQFTKSGVCRRLILACSKGGKGRENACYQARRTAKTDCQASIVVKLWGDDLLHLVEVYLEHNHPVRPGTARFFRCYKKMADVVVEDVAEQPSEHENLQYVENEHGNSTEIGQLKLAEGDSETIHQFFASMQNKNPNFYYLVDLDKRGRLRNLFWADARSRAAYQYFGDVVWFDTSCVGESYDVPLALFVGVNHHGQLVLFGCALLSDESMETYVWLFRSWLRCMLGCKPTAIISDYSKAIQDAIAKEFPGVRHRICLSHIMKKVPEKLRGFAEFKEIKKALKKAVYDSLVFDEFEGNWTKMIEAYGLADIEWLNSLYECRHLWVPIYLKDTFWAGLSISQRSESTSAFFDGLLYPRTTLKQFFSKYESILQSKFKKEAQADSDSFHKTPLSISKYYMEEQLSKLYTLNMFRKFQEELKATMYCHVTPIKVDGSIHTFEVKECSYMEDGKKTENKDHQVLYNADEHGVQCICGYFQFWGILCRHALSVFKLQQVFEIPSQYILDRWRKDFKRLHALARSPINELPSNLLERYQYLSFRCLQLAEVGFISDDRYQLTLKLISELEKSVLDDTTCRDGTACRDRQPMLLPFGTQSTENVQNQLMPQFGFSEGSKLPDSLQVKRRGRPPKRAQESNVETQVRPNKEQDFLSSPLLGNENNLLQSAPTTSHIDTQIGMQGGIDLMEDVNQNNLSFGRHFGLHINHQHHIEVETRMQPSNLLQGQYDQQTIGTQSRVQWIYQQILQEDQISKEPSGQTTG